ncbi:MAG: 23S rRNA (pseudouridine(1915)-N(3))-methyltransferase RlmH [bacterium]
MKFTVIAFGKLRTKEYKTLYDEYMKRLSPYAKVETIELEPESFNPGEEERAKKREAEKLLDYIYRHKLGTVILCDEKGKEFTSHEFSQELENQGSVVLVIGGSLGFGESVREMHKVKLALSKMTMPHELARVVLAEQLYRAVTIIKGKTYHY